MDESEISSDNRGGEKGKSRIYSPETKRQIIKIRTDLEKEEKGAEQIHEIS